MSAGSTIVPSMRYRDAHAAMEWLCSMLGFAAKAVYDGPDNTVAHAELTLGSGMIMLGSATNKNPYPDRIAHPEDTGGRVTSPVYVLVPDCTPVYERLRNTGANIIAELRTMDYGGQAFTVCDPEGYMWSVGEYDPWAPAESAGTAA